MTLAQRRVVQEFETNQFPALKNAIDEAAGASIPVNVNWDSLAVPGDEHNYVESWPKIYFEPLIAALKEVGHDDIGREAVKTGIKKINVQNVKGCDYGDSWASLEDGELTLDHGFVNAWDTEGRKKGLVQVLEKSL